LFAGTPERTCAASADFVRLHVSVRRSVTRPATTAM